MCEKLAQGFYAVYPAENRTHDLLLASPTLYHSATTPPRILFKNSQYQPKKTNFLRELRTTATGSVERIPASGRSFDLQITLLELHNFMTCDVKQS